MNADFFRVDSVEIKRDVIKPKSDAPFMILRTIMKDEKGKHEISIFPNWGKEHYHVRKISDDVIDRRIEFVVPGSAVEDQDAGE